MESLNTRAFRERIMRQFKDKKVPVMGVFEITGRCNFNCKMCYVHTKSNREFLKTERDGDWWISVMEEACKQGMLFALITGGECLLHADFRRIYTYLRSMGVYTSINTNGYLLTQDMVDFLKENPPFEMQITLYGSDEDSYYRVTGSRGFSQVKESILRAKKAGLNLRVAVTPNPYSKGETERILEYLKGLNVVISLNEALHTSYDDKGEQKLAESELEVEDKIQYLSTTQKGLLKVIPEEELPPVGGGKTEQIMGFRCSAGRVAFHITQDGYMMPCATAHDVRVPIEKPTDFLQAWEKIMEHVKRFQLPVECEGCAYKKACLHCPILRGGKVGNGHCDPAVCEMTRKLVAAGVKKLEQAEKSCD